jgi:hypothetical protein
MNLEDFAARGLKAQQAIDAAGAGPHILTRARIDAGLELLTLQLANGDRHGPPDGWASHEWAYIKGVASSAIMSLRARPIGAGQS